MRKVRGRGRVLARKTVQVALSSQVALKTFEMFGGVGVTKIEWKGISQVCSPETPGTYLRGKPTMRRSGQEQKC